MKKFLLFIISFLHSLSAPPVPKTRRTLRYHGHSEADMEMIVRALNYDDFKKSKLTLPILPTTTSRPAQMQKDHCLSWRVMPLILKNTTQESITWPLR